MEFNKLKVSELRKELKSRGLSTLGNKNELIERLQAAMKRKNDDLIEADSVGDLDEDLLNEDDDEHIEESDSVLNELDALVSHDLVIKSTPQKRRSDEAPQNGTASKRIVLNRPAVALEDKAKSDECNEKKTVKLSELSAKERLEMRAKKFGVPLSSDAKKEVRAERFGLAGSGAKTDNKSSSAPIGASSPASADVLRQRAERFGVTVSTALTKLEQQDRLEKRKQRFGQTVSPNDKLPAAAKAEARLERFKQSVK